jgi:gluconolactonase
VDTAREEQLIDIDMRAPDLEALIPPDARMDQIAHGLAFGEGPVWCRRTEQLFYVDILGNTIWRWKPGVGNSVVLRPSGKANGMTLDTEGRLIVAGWASRTIWRMGPEGTIVVLASHYDGKKFNSPNDIVMKSDGALYWTDPQGALVNVGMAGEDVQRYLDVQGVFRLSPDGKDVDLVVGDIQYPNGILFSPDESRIYANDTRLAHVRVFNVRKDGSVDGGEIFHKLNGIEPGVADGMKMDTRGNLYCTGPGGIHVINTSGKLLGRIKIPGFHATNLAWGDADWKTMYITTFTGVYRLRVSIPGIPV